MAIGDSITYLDAHHEEANNRVTKGYMERVTDKLPYINYVNHGHSGWTTMSMAKAIEKLNIEKADIYTVFLGTNDWWQGLSIGSIDDYKNSTGDSTVFGAYRVIVNKIRTLNPEAHVILLTPLQRGDFVYFKKFTNNAYGSYKDKNGRNLSEFADAVKQIADYERFDLVDLYGKSGIKPKNAVKFKLLKSPAGEYVKYEYPGYTNIPFNPATDDYPYPIDAVNMTYDGLHPSDKGMAVIAKMLIKVMKKY